MVLDFDAIYKKLGIDRETLHRAGDRFNNLRWNIPDTKEAFIKAYLSLPPDELLSLIRVKGLYKRYPDYFIFDGPTEKAKKELSPLSENKSLPFERISLRIYNKKNLKH